MRKSLQIIGPFATNYSFARVNRGLAKALSYTQDEYEITLYQSRERIDKWPEEDDLNKFPYLRELWRKEREETDVAIYFDFPKEGLVEHGFKDLPSKTKIFYIPWEESIYPEIWVKEINENLHGVMVTSGFVRDILRKNGVKVPTEVIWNGIDEGMMGKPNGNYPLKTKKNFKFLHVSSARKRKGIDVLIKSYFEEFKKDDDICLVIKSFPGPDNQVKELLQELHNENSPEIEHITSPDVSDQEMINLLHSCDCTVYPSRAEGFGLPILESMFHSVPVIATNYSAYLDFANEENAFLIDYNIEKATDSEMVNIGAVWAEPDSADLKKKMRFIFENIDSDIVKRKVRLAKEAASEITWKNATKKTQEFVKRIEGITKFKNQNGAVISFFNNEDGVADYTKELYSNIENSFKNFYYISNKDIDSRVELDADNVVRTWESGEEEFSETLKFIKDNNIQYVHIQYHSGINFPASGLDTLIQKLKDIDRKVYITLHAVKGNGFNITKQSKNLGLVDKLFIHNQEDYDLVNTENKILFHHPRSVIKRRSKNKLQKDLGFGNSPVIATHGKLVLEKIDIENVLDAVSELRKDYPDILYLAVNAVVSSNTKANADFESLKAKTKELGIENNVIFISDFLSKDQVYMLLQASDMILFPYKDVGESASSAISKSLASERPTIVTDIKMFSEFRDEVFKIENSNSRNIAKAIKTVLGDGQLRQNLVKAASNYINNYDYNKAAILTLLEY